MKKIFFILAIALAITTCVTGCDPKKTGGGGKQQTYDRSTGQYN